MNNVSISGYHKWYHQKDTIHKDHVDPQLIKTEFDKLKKKGEYQRIYMNLSKKMNHKKVSRIMRENGLYSTIRRANPYRVMARKQKAHLSIPNTLNREFKVTSPYTKSVTDISYFHYKNGIAYLSAIKDICTREILAWRVYMRLEHSLVLDTIDDLKIYCTSRDILMDKLLMHSDQGWHYDHVTFRSKILACGITHSMSRKGNDRH